MPKYNNKRLILYIVLLIAILIIWWIISGFLFDESTPETQLMDCFTAQVNMPYYVRTYTLGTIIEQVIICESGGNHYDSNGEILRGKAGEWGLCQFKQKTWDMFNKERGTNLDIESKEDQLDMINWAFEKGYQYHWTCAKGLNQIN